MNKRIKILMIFCVVISLLWVMPKEEKVVEKTTTASNVWYGDELTVNVKKGTDEYIFRSVYPDAKVFPHSSYEMSNHMLTANNVNYEIPQLLMMVDASNDYNWTPNGEYTFADSNYEVLYCCDAETPYKDGVYYKRSNLEDSEYYNKSVAPNIRAIVTNSYPYITVEQMKANLSSEGFKDADKLTRAEIITAVQAAIWSFSNRECGNYLYGRTFSVPHNSQWGGALHDFTNEMDVWWTEGKRKFSTSDEVALRINSLIEHLKKQTAMYADKHQLIVSEISMDNSAPELAEDGTYTVDLKVKLNNSGSNKLDDIKLEIYVDEEVYSSKKIQLGVDEYKLTVKAKAGQSIKAVVTGTQVIPKGVYLYEPQGGRSASQSLVGVANGETNIYAESDVLVIQNVEPSDPPLDPEEPTDPPIVTDEPTQSLKPTEEVEETETPKASKLPLDPTNESEVIVEADDEEKYDAKEIKEPVDIKKDNYDKRTPDTSDNNDSIIYIRIMFSAMLLMITMVLLKKDIKDSKDEMNK